MDKFNSEIYINRAFSAALMRCDKLSNKIEQKASLHYIKKSAHNNGYEDKDAFINSINRSSIKGADFALGLGQIFMYPLDFVLGDGIRWSKDYNDDADGLIGEFLEIPTQIVAKASMAAGAVVGAAVATPLALTKKSPKQFIETAATHSGSAFENLSGNAVAVPIALGLNCARGCLAATKLAIAATCGLIGGLIGAGISISQSIGKNNNNNVQTTMRRNKIDAVK